MKLLLTSSGISNKSIYDALVDLLGKPVSEANALFVPTGIYPFKGGQRYAWSPICGETAPKMCQLGWKSVGILELSVLPSIDKSNWLPTLEEADAMLVWGGDPLFLSYWMQQSGLTNMLPSLLDKLVYVGVSAGSIVTASVFAEDYSENRSCAGNPITSGEIVFSSSTGDVHRMFLTATGMGLTDFAIIPHFENKNHIGALLTNAEKWASKLLIPVYAIDDNTAIKINNGIIDVVSEGQWKLFNPRDAK